MLSSNALSKAKQKKQDLIANNSEIKKIPTTFISLSPEKVSFESGSVDLLFGVFHIMWSDMPKRRSYGLRLADQFSSQGDYLGCNLVCTFPHEGKVSCNQ